MELATKFGITASENGKFGFRGDPQYVRSACEASLRRLGVTSIDLYYQHRIDTTVPIEVTVMPSWFQFYSKLVCQVTDIFHRATKNLISSNNKVYENNLEFEICILM